MRSLSLLAALATLGSTARADLVCHATDVPLAPTNWNAAVQIPRFDPALGTLNFVDVCVTGRLTGTYRVESPDASPVVVFGHVAAEVRLSRPDASLILSATPFQDFVDILSAFDGIIDFRGTSGATHTGIDVLLTTQLNLSTPTDLALFSGPAGSPGTIALPVQAHGVSIATGGGHILTQFQTQAAAMISICYDYTPVADPFCAGDGSGSACPCGNESPLGADAGCRSSIGTGGALRGAGTASLASDSLSLTCTGLPSATTTLFAQGTAPINAGAGAVFGDGLRCVGGTLTRLSMKTASGGVVTYPQAGDAPLSVRGAVPAGAVRVYQVWYRNAAAFCTSDTFNLSQGVSVQWIP
jgi:hypothetical protein